MTEANEKPSCSGAVPSIFAPPRNCWSVARAEQAGLLVDASDYYSAFYAAALEARRYILMSGWQFDSTVELLRAKNTSIAEAAAAPTALLPFLNHLCETRPALEIDILAWDFHVVLAFEREWMQRILFHWKTHERLRFHFDSCHPSGGCHHQKFVVIDGHTAFLGGIDLCEDRWDDRRHLADNPLRISRKKPQKPYHDVQAYVGGSEAVRHLTELFCERWRCAGADPLALPATVPDSTEDPLEEPKGALVLPPGKLAFSRTDPQDERLGALRHVAEMFGDAIDSAERLIYLETQYFSSREIRARLETRMRARDRSKLQIIVLVNARAEAIKEQVAVGLRQTENLVRLRRVAADTGHAFGCYYTLSDPPMGNPDTEMHRTYIHTKLVLVDDRILSVGSANLTNRSMGLDTELQVTWDAALHESPGELVARIRAVRVSLLSEHTGVRREDAFAEMDGLVARLDTLAERADSRLRAHPWPTADETKALELVDPQELPFDPAAPDDSAADEFSEDKVLFRASLGELWSSIVGRVTG